MAKSVRREDAPLSQQVLREPWRFDFYQATRLLEWIALRERRARGTARHSRLADVGVGGDVPPGQEAVRFHATASARFPAGEVLQIQAGDAKRPESAPLPSRPSGALESATPGAARPAGGGSSFQMFVSFLGLTGPSGVLPTYFHRLVRRRLRARDHVLRDFFDLFNHRSISFYYRAWVKYRFPFAFERSHRQRVRPAAPSARGAGLLAMRSDHQAVSLFVEVRRRCEARQVAARNRSRPDPDVFAKDLMALVGLATRGQASRTAEVEPVLLHFAGLFGHYPRSAIGLERILTDHFDIPIEVLQFQGQWLGIDPVDRSRLGGESAAQPSGSLLGTSAVLGESVWDVESRIRIKIGPLSTRDQFFAFLPAATAREMKALCQLVRLYSGPELEFDLQLVLSRGMEVEVQLGKEEELCPLLGWNIWLHTGPFDVENGDAVFSDEVTGGLSR